MKRAGNTTGRGGARTPEKPEGKRSLDGPESRWEDDIQTCFKKWNVRTSLYGIHYNY